MIRLIPLGLLIGCPPSDDGNDPETLPPGSTSDGSGTTSDTAEPDPTAQACAVGPTIAQLSEPGMPALSDGDEVVLAHGPQGGWHVAVNAVIEGRSELWLQPFVELVQTGEQLAGNDNAFLLPLWGYDAGTCSGDMQGMIAYLDDPPLVDQDTICGLVGQQMILRLVATDPQTDATGEAQVRVVGVADPSDTCP